MEHTHYQVRLACDGTVTIVDIPYATSDRDAIRQALLVSRGIVTGVARPPREKRYIACAYGPGGSLEHATPAVARDIAEAQVQSWRERWARDGVKATAAVELA